MVDFTKLETDLKDALHGVVVDVEQHEPAIADGVVQALGAAGAPSVVAASLGGLIEALLDHFKAATPPTVTVTPAAEAPTDTSAWAPPATT
jgi:hypothetical protein